MESDASSRAHASEPAPGDSIRSLIVSFLSYLELRLKLSGLEARETGIRFLVLALLLVSAIVFCAGFVAMLVVFLLYLMMQIFHWEWGWSALALAAVLVIISIVLGLIFRCKIVEPLFPVTFAEFQKDRQWLEHTTKDSG
jgi:uncharacterized membrane protein YqjE